MKSSNMTWSLIVFFTLIFATAALGHAAATVTASPSGKGRFTVNGDGFIGVEGVQIVIQYDHTALTNPRVEQGSLIQGMMMVPPSIDISGCSGLCYSGTYKYPEITPTSSGSIATISFDTLGNTPTNVTGSATLKDINGNAQVLSFTVQITGSNTSTLTNTTTTDGANNGANTGSGTGTGTTVTSSGSVPPSATGNAIPVVLGSVSMPDAGTPVVAKTNDVASLPVSEPEKIQKQTSDTVEKEIAPPTGEKAPQSAIQEKSAALNISVLERFREYQGEKNPQNLIALFKSAITGNRQEPTLALSDGKTIVKVFVDISATGKAAPNFALKEAKLVSLKRSSDSAWVVEVLPNKGTFDAAVIVLEDDKTVKLPLTVAPPLSADIKIGKGGVLSEADFISFLKERGTEKAPRFDLNGDGKRDYIDDYIFTVNYLAKADAAKPAAEKKSQGTK